MRKIISTIVLALTLSLALITAPLTAASASDPDASDELRVCKTVLAITKQGVAEDQSALRDLLDRYAAQAQAISEQRQTITKQRATIKRLRAQLHR